MGGLRLRSRGTGTDLFTKQGGEGGESHDSEKEWEMPAGGLRADPAGGNAPRPRSGNRFRVSAPPGPISMAAGRA